MTRMQSSEYMRLYGLKSCDTCRKALTILKNHGFDVQLEDVRDNPVAPEGIAIFAEIFGDRLVNRKSLTWRSLSDEQKARPIAELLCEYPTLMKRPVIESGDLVTLGWDACVRRAWGIDGD